jgi:NADH-quinone oxidoreductase subunit G
VAVTPYASDEMKRIAQVLLPAGAFAESSGTYVNLEGRWQSQAGAVKPLGAARPAWKILRVLGNLLNLPAFDYQSSEQIRDELKAQIDAAQPSPEPSTGAPWAASRAEPVIDLAMYQIDPVLRRSGSLARTADGRAASQVYAGAAT